MCLVSVNGSNYSVFTLKKKRRESVQIRLKGRKCVKFSSPGGFIIREYFADIGSQSKLCETINGLFSKCTLS